jgi:hypothetical protein
MKCPACPKKFLWWEASFRFRNQVSFRCTNCQTPLEMKEIPELSVRNSAIFWKSLLVLFPLWPLLSISWSNHFLAIIFPLLAIVWASGVLEVEFFDLVVQREQHLSKM